MHSSRIFLSALAVLVTACGGTVSNLGPAATRTVTQPSGSAPAGGLRATPAATGKATAYPGWPGATVPNDPEIVPSLVSSELGIGPNRFLFTIVDRANKPVPAPDVEVALKFFELAGDPATPRSETKATFLETSPGRGLYRAAAAFDCAGDWGVDMTVRKAGVPDRTARGVFSVRPTTTTPAIGSRMAPYDTPTAPPAELRTISTDTNPDPDFYRTTVRQALDAGKPFLFVIATPAFCKTRTCGPALDLVKAAATPFKDRVGFINVEPYQLRLENGSLQPVLDARGQLQAVPLVGQLGLVTEPYTFAVDRTGTIVAKYEGIVGRDELDTILAQISR